MCLGSLDVRVTARDREVPVFTVDTGSSPSHDLTFGTLRDSCVLNPDYDNSQSPTT